MVVRLRFIYYRHTIPTIEEVASEKLLILTQVIRCFNSEGYLQLLGDITGDYSGREVNSEDLHAGQLYFERAIQLKGMESYRHYSGKLESLKVQLYSGRGNGHTPA